MNTEKTYQSSTYLVPQNEMAVVADMHASYSSLLVWATLAARDLGWPEEMIKDNFSEDYDALNNVEKMLDK
jgi:hypothetical protein